MDTLPAPQSLSLLIQLVTQLIYNDLLLCRLGSLFLKLVPTLVSAALFVIKSDRRLKFPILVCHLIHPFFSLTTSSYLSNVLYAFSYSATSCACLFPILEQGGPHGKTLRANVWLCYANAQRSKTYVPAEE